MSRAATITRKQERNLKKLKRKFGDFDWSNPCDRCRGINAQYDAFILGLLGQDAPKLSKADKDQIESALATSSDAEGNIDWALVDTLISGVQTLRAHRWIRIYTNACTPELAGLSGVTKIDPDDPSTHRAWAGREACQRHQAQQNAEEPTETSRPRFNVFEAVAGGMKVRPFDPGTTGTSSAPPPEETPKWLWAVPAALLILLMR